MEVPMTVPVRPIRILMNGPFFIMNRMPSLYCFIEKRCIASAGILGSGTKEVTSRVSTGVVQQMAIAT